jgi:hypothetical protein
MKITIIKKIILTTMFFGCLLVKEMYSITGAQAARQQQISKEIENILIKKVNESNYDEWIEEINGVVNKYKDVNLPEIQTKIKSLQNIAAIKNKPESIEKKVEDTKKLTQNQPTKNPPTRNLNEPSGEPKQLTKEEEKNIEDSLSKLIKRYSDINDTLRHKTLGLNEWDNWKKDAENAIIKYDTSFFATYEMIPDRLNTLKYNLAEGETKVEEYKKSTTSISTPPQGLTGNIPPTPNLNPPSKGGTKSTQQKEKILKELDSYLKDDYSSEQMSKFHSLENFKDSIADTIQDGKKLNDPEINKKITQIEKNIQEAETLRKTQTNPQPSPQGGTKSTTKEQKIAQKIKHLADVEIKVNDFDKWVNNVKKIFEKHRNSTVKEIKDELGILRNKVPSFEDNIYATIDKLYNEKFTAFDTERYADWKNNIEFYIYHFLVLWDLAETIKAERNEELYNLVDVVKNSIKEEDTRRSIQN